MDFLQAEQPLTPRPSPAATPILPQPPSKVSKSSHYSQRRGYSLFAEPHLDQLSSFSTTPASTHLSFHDQRLPASVCQQVSAKSSFATTLVAKAARSVAGHRWKKAFLHCVCLFSQAWPRQRTSADWAAALLPFSNTLSMPFYQLSVLVFCKHFGTKSREMDVWKRAVVLAN